ncbi:MAG: hypothetical protein CVV22_11225 [Ignavibacteriae bacterium HGW-Ignavibacteriae-1]|nr:MAG: hypothetical protein CVV22_11225 [Ignavibacteriae bacterium HGW-Ignavibacteriae-1]
MKRLYRISKFLHKYSSLTLIVFLIWMSISGILMNHPELISGLSIPYKYLPDNYSAHNWARSTLNNVQFSNDEPKLAYIGGFEGVWKTTDAGVNFSSLNVEGLPDSRYYRRVKSMMLTDIDGKELLLAGTYGGLYFYDKNINKWTNIELGGKNPRIAKVLSYKDSIAVFSESNAFISHASLPLNFQQSDLRRFDDNNKLTMVEFMFSLHTGELWGLPGKLLFDVAGLILLFLAISGFFLWITPKKSVFKLKLLEKYRKSRWTLYKFFTKYHLKLGIYSAVILFIFGLTGFFMRPPMIAVIFGSDIDKSWILGMDKSNPWNHRIRNAMYDEKRDKFIIDTKDGYWVSESGLRGFYTKQAPPAPIFAMGATVLETDYAGNHLLGSFAGLFKVNYEGDIVDVATGKPPYNVAALRPGTNLVTGYFATPDGEEYIATHFAGLMPANKKAADSDKFIMPEHILNTAELPFWNFLFELHNGRIFQAILGPYHMLLIPLASLIFMILIITGVFDWFYRR